LQSVGGLGEALLSVKTKATRFQTFSALTCLPPLTRL